MHKRMGTAIVLTMFVLASFTVIATDYADGSDATPRYVDGLDVFENATVTPFTFPDYNGKPILQALYEATDSIDISIYTLTSKAVMALLYEKQEAGVDVRVLIEGTPLGIKTETEMEMLKKLDDLGADVRVINAKGNDSVYPYVHNKYAVIDGDTVIVTSENWTASNIGSGGNRGWGVIIENAGYAEYMGNVFEGDYDDSREGVEPIEIVYPDLEPFPDKLTYTIGSYTKPPTFTDVSVSPVLSPDNSFVSLKNFIGMSQTRVYAEEMDVSKEYASLAGDTPLAWMNERAEAGKDVRFVLNTSYETGDKAATGEHHLLVDKLNGTTKIKAAGISKCKTVGDKKTFNVTHNKGIIVDDMVWVGSVNWTSNSMLNNREVAVIIYSKDVVDYYEEHFTNDFGKNYAYGNISITFRIDEKNEIVKRYYAGDEIIPPEDPVKPKDENYKYTFTGWDGFAPGMTASENRTFVAKFDQSPYIVNKLVFDVDGVQSVIYFEQGDEIIPPDDPVKPYDENYKYAFVGWEGLTPGMTASGDATFTAKFDAIPYEAQKIVFVSDGIQTVIYLEAGDEIPLPENPVKPNDGRYSYVFDHWEGYEDGMLADGNATFNAVFTKTLLPGAREDIPWYYALIILAIVVLGLLVKAAGKGGRKRYKSSYSKGKSSSRKR